MIFVFIVLGRASDSSLSRSPHWAWL